MIMNKTTEKLKEIKEEVVGCKKCSLRKTRILPVVGQGSHQAKVMFIGEAPGANEDKTGVPFCGSSGRILDELFQSIGYKREDAYVCNILKCRPPENRDPLPEEIEVCKPHLFKQIEIIKPLFVCTLGRHAAQLILDKNISMSKVHGQRFEVDGYYIFPIHHPAAALYARSTLTTLEEDFAKLYQLLKTGLEIPLQECEQPHQMGLF